jgi:hypothetical protein
MARRRSGAKRSTQERLESYFYCLDYYGNVVTVPVYVKGTAVYLSGPHGRHLVHPSNERSLEGWRREAAHVWHFTNVIDVPAVLLGSESDKQAKTEIQRQSEARKRELEEHEKKKGTQSGSEPSG